MIRNLNQVAFQGFGAVLPERERSVRTSTKGASCVINLSQEESTVYRARSETTVSCSSGTCVLSASQNGTEFLSFYLDKPVRLKEGIFFSLEAFKAEASVRLEAKLLPEPLGARKSVSRRINHRFLVDGLYTFFYQEKEQGFLFPGESHPMSELTYVDQGELHSVVDGQDLLLKQGDIVVYGPNQWHMQYSDIGVAPRFVTISFDCPGQELTPLLNRRFPAPQQAATLLHTMLREQERMDRFSDDMILAQLGMLLISLIREAESPSGNKLRSTNTVHSENEVIRNAQQFISAHIREKLSVPMVAQEVDVSASYLTVLFHKNLQISPGEYIRRVKLQESKQMIRDNNMNFTEIAAALQYSTVHHFSRQFKEKFGITPTEYAKSVR